MTNDTPALDFKSATLYAIRLVLNKGDSETLVEMLAQRMKESGTFFEDEPIVIDATALEHPLDWGKLLAALKAHRLPVIGVAATGQHLLAAKALGLTEIDLSVSPIKPVIEESKQPAKTAEPPPINDTPTTAPPPPSAAPVIADEALPAMLVNGPLRSGQRIYARNRDLIVIGLVSQGAEVIADGNIHVYGPLRGKAMAGALGDQRAQIFTTLFEPELVAVAGVYRVIDTKLSAHIHKKAATVFLDGSSLNIKPLEH